MTSKALGGSCCALMCIRMTSSVSGSKFMAAPAVRRFGEQIDSDYKIKFTQMSTITRSVYLFCDTM
jgi:hypothetical protein